MNIFKLFVIQYSGFMKDSISTFNVSFDHLSSSNVLHSYICLVCRLVTKPLLSASYRITIKCRMSLEKDER